MENKPENSHETKYNKIRQCRPDRKYGIEEYKNIGFFNKNRNYTYHSYSDDTASEFLLENFGKYINDLYLSINIPQSKSDFFLVASLYFEGGISADVCSKCTASVDYLIRDKSKVHIVRDSNGFQKKFLYAPPKNRFFQEYLKNLISKFNYFQSNNMDLDYENFSSQKMFDDFVNISFSAGGMNESNIEIINEDLYNSVIINDLSEEVLLDYSNESIKKISIRGVVDRSVDFSNVGYDRVLGRNEGEILSKSKNFHIIGENKHPMITSGLNHSVALPDLELYNIKDVTVSGHCCIWKNDAFLRQESYLSVVSEEEMQAGFWKSPRDLPPSFSVDDEVIVSFGAGYGCYGHYLVDEIPRLAFTKKNFGGRKIP